MSRLILLVQPCPAEQSLMNPSMPLQMTPQRTLLDPKYLVALQLAKQTATQSAANEEAPQGGEVAPTESSAAAAPSEDPPEGGGPAGHGSLAD